MTMRRSACAFVLLAAVACGRTEPELVRSPAAAPAPSPPLPPAKTDEAVLNRETRSFTVGACRFEIAAPEVARPEALSRAVRQWVDESLTEWRETMTGVACDAAPAEITVHLRSHGLLQLSWSLPPGPMEKFTHPRNALFITRTGERVERIVKDDASDALQAKLRPIFQSSYRTVKRCDTSQWAPNLAAFTFSDTGVTFSDWESIPMADKACGGDIDTSVDRVLPFTELAPFLRDDIARLVTSK